MSEQEAHSGYARDARMRAWLDDVQLSNRLGCPHYKNPGELKADLRVLLDVVEAAHEVVLELAACNDCCGYEHTGRLEGALAHLAAGDEAIEKVRLASEDARPRTFDDRDELLRTLTEDEQSHRYVDCCWTWRNYDGCVRLPVFRLATPHGHMDFCREHIGPAIAMLPPEWLDGWAFREPPTVEVSDEIPF